MSDLEKMLSIKQDDWIEACGEIDDLKSKLKIAMEALEDARIYHADCLHGTEFLRVLKLEDCKCVICEALEKLKHQAGDV